MFAMKLTEIIIQKIKQEGPVSFRDFMEMALYHPQLGYYTSENEKFGKNGDYFTSPLVSNMYGQMIGLQVEEMWQIMENDLFTIVEYGAGSGTLCFDILSYLKRNNSLYEHLNYYIIEKSSYLRRKQQKLLGEKVKWIDCMSELKAISGCVLSNEVVDNFSVHVVVMEDELMEVFIDYTHKFTEVLRPAGKNIKHYLKQQNIQLPRGYRIEINLEAHEWIKEIAVNLHRGFVMTIDYGFLCNELYSPDRKSGTLACYHKHAINLDPYANIGEQDITAHVNFSALDIWGKNYGLESIGFCNQYYFLHSLGLASHLRKLEQEMYPADMETFCQVYQLLMQMGNKFKVLIQQKGIKTKALTGMQFASKVF